MLTSPRKPWKKIPCPACRTIHEVPSEVPTFSTSCTACGAFYLVPERGPPTQYDPAKRLTGGPLCKTSNQTVTPGGRP